MPGYRFEVRDCSGATPRLVVEWTAAYDDDEAAWQVASMETLSGMQQVLVYRDGEARPFGSKVADDLADAMGSEAWRP